ncbi:hypothetical protein B2G52_07260 [Neisseria lactamica]|uniref:Secreted protein n=1 Tax=Neisseria lactamica TaxID=486 RepID=A0AAU8VI15_NEILA|nr:hypothetical protein B2G52_07260 [Neisseria lactamica]
MNIFVTDFSYRFMSLLILSYIPSIHSSEDDTDFGKRVMIVTFFCIFRHSNRAFFLIKSLGRFILPRLFLCYRPNSLI